MRRRSTTQIMSLATPARFRAAVRRTASLLRAGQVVAVPTETVYGLAANAMDARAVARIYRVKRRPAHNPIIVHVASVAMARQCVAHWPAMAARLARTFWPGALTLVLPKASQIPDIVTAGGPTVGVRWPDHPFMQAVIRVCGFPLAAPSANPAARLSPTRAEHVLTHLGGKIPLIVDGGRTRVGIESTVVDLTVRLPRILRPGIVSAAALARVIGPVQLGGVTTEKALQKRRQTSTARRTQSNFKRKLAALRSPGLLRRHYAPRARLRVWRWRTLGELRARVAAHRVATARAHVIAHTRVPQAPGWGGVIVLPRDAVRFARELYAALHRADAAGARLIVVEAPPRGAMWRAVADRLSRAAA